jgi:hypothetical protein
MNQDKTVQEEILNLENIFKFIKRSEITLKGDEILPAYQLFNWLALYITQKKEALKQPQQEIKEPEIVEPVVTTIKKKK